MKIWVRCISQNNYVAQLEGRPEISGAGENRYEAVGDLICQHSQRFNIEVQDQDPVGPRYRP